ncbi:MAG: VWA domain-containing protein [Terracidiphilus sp.]
MMPLPRASLMVLVGVPAFFCAQLGTTQQPTPPAAPAHSETSSPSQPPDRVLSQRRAPAPPITEGRIHLDLVVADKSGQPVPGLEMTDFTLLDNNLPSKILSFHAFDGHLQKAGPPAGVILLIDTVNLPFSQVSSVRQQIAAFLLQNGGHLAAPTSIYFLSNDGVTLLQKPSTDGNQVAAALDQVNGRLRTFGRATAFGAIERFQFSLKMLTSVIETESRKPGRKLLIWAGPGWPALSGPGFDITAEDQRRTFRLIVGLSSELRESRISLYSISQGMPGVGTNVYRDFLGGVKSAGKAVLPDLALKVLAVQSGGLAMPPSNDLTAEIDSCVKDASSFYTLSFDPPHTDKPDEYHDLKVFVSKPGLTARTNTGYYNQP